ncbi:Uncharacterized membrane protein YdjX, TVP38/TMEM64 family, SNARE-associated domain [Mesobacillus persicus]|uniref:TVP38/TMEM64 family membrane protein n=1 Tax=Mesobacillus persicus TaxID=930146 RepID=A0A1H7W164_9BACI|nr:VTT domain-containing protein [Mesobacillus persicus]SEM14747.1 Uncharacterized membrane protein YdjX, TVP38/TMEM64 family, SNARE-associated domain [Mesobacillus persicus]
MEQFLPNNSLLAIIISLLINIFIAIAGILPSAFITAGNILYFGFFNGLIVSIIGEALGAVVSFYLYRKGFKAIERKWENKRDNRLLERLKETKGVGAVLLVIGLRVFPFIPSGLVTLAASMSKMKLIHFAVASTVGKIPALWIEAYSVHSVLNMETKYQIWTALIGIAAVISYFTVTKRKRRKE